MTEVSQNIKYVKLDDGVSFELVRTNPKLTTNTKLMYNGKKMYMESYASSPLMNRTQYKNIHVKRNSTFNKDIASFLSGSGSQAYSVYQNFSDIVISDSYDNQFETMYWCGAEYIDSSFYTEEIGFIAPLYLREKLPNYFLIFRLDSPSNYNLNIDNDGNILDSTFDFKADILNKAVLIKTFDLREGSVLGDYIHNYVEQESFEFDKSIYVNFSNGEVTYYGINKFNGVLEKKVENFENELLKNDNPILKDDKWFTEGFERNNLIFPYIINIEYLFDDENFKHIDGESYDFARYIGVYCNNIEFGEFSNLNDLTELGETQDNAIYYFEDNNNNLHRYSTKISDSENEFDLKIDGKNSDLFDVNLISGFEKEKITGYAEPLDIFEGFINRAQYGFELLKKLEPGDWIGIEYNGHIEYYFADDKTIKAGESQDMLIGEYEDFRFSVNENSSLNDIAEALVKSINHNIKSKFEAKCSNNIVVLYAKREGKEYNSAKILFEDSLIYNEKILLPISDYIEYQENDESIFGNYYIDNFTGACDIEIDPVTDRYKNVFKIYMEEYTFFSLDRYLKTNNGNGRRITTNMMYINLEGNIDTECRLVIVDKASNGGIGYDVSVSSTYQVEILDKFKPNYGILSWFPIKDFDFDINYSSYGQYGAFVDECNILSKKVTYKNIIDTGDSDSLSKQEYAIKGIKELAKSPFFDEYNNSFETEYDYYLEQIHPDLCLLSKTTPYITKWGYFDEQKDSCENPYRLNVSKVFGMSNLSANTFLRNCDTDGYTHSMPYYMTLNTPDYYKDYQYIESDELYINNNKNNIEQYTMIEDDENSILFDYVNYWVNIFKNTEVDKFSEFFCGKKYGNRFNRKYSRLLGGDKFHNPSTLFRGVKFEIVRQYNGVEKRSSEYNNYKFSFIYIPVMINSLVFSSTVYFVKNDTFKFIVGIIFVNTMLGTYGHNIFKGNIDYFNKGFLYAACKDVIRPDHTKEPTFKFTIKNGDSDSDSDLNDIVIDNVQNDIWKYNYVFGKENKFHMWIDTVSKKTMIITKYVDKLNISDIIYEFDIDENNINNSIIEGIKTSSKTGKKYTEISSTNNDSNYSIFWDKYYEEYDTTISAYDNFQYYNEISCEIIAPNIEFYNLSLMDVCNVEWKNLYNGDYEVDVSNISFKSESLQNILINMGTIDSVDSIKFHDNTLGVNFEKVFNNDDIKVDVVSGSITIGLNNPASTKLTTTGSIEDLKMDIIIKDHFDDSFDSLGFKDYFSVFNQISAYNITESINNDYNVKYYSTVEDNKYKIRIVEPDSIEIVDKYEAIPVEVTQNNKSVIGSVEIKEKTNADKIGIKVINRYSGFYNPIFNDILYYGDYTFYKNLSRLRNAQKYEFPYSNTNIEYNYNDGYGIFGVIKNLYYHKTNISRSDKILTSEKPVYPAINEYALDYRDYNIFSSSWDEGYFISQDDINNSSICGGIGSMKDGLCMFGSKYLNLPDDIFIDTFVKGQLWDDTMVTDIRDNTGTEIMYKEINNNTVRYYLFIEKRLKRYLTDNLLKIFEKYINKTYSFGDKETIYDDVEEYVEKNLLRLYKVDKVYLYVKNERMRINNKMIENEYLEFMDKTNEEKIVNGFPAIDGKLTDSKFIMSRVNEFDRFITYNLNRGFKESFGIAVSFKRK